MQCSSFTELVPYWWKSAFFFFFLIMSLPCLSTFVFPNYRAIGIESSCVFREGRRHVVSMFSFSPGYAPCVLTLFKVLFARFSGP